MWLGSNGTADRWPPFLISDATDTTTSTSISNAKKNPASLVETAHAADHHQHRQRGEDHGQVRPTGCSRAQVVLQGDGQEAAGDRDHRGHRDDVAHPGRAAPWSPRWCRRTSCPTNVMNPPVDGCARENWASVLPSSAIAMPAAMMVSGEATPAVMRQEAEAEVEAHGGPDVGHRGRRDVHDAQDAAVQPELVAYLADWGALALPERKGFGVAHSDPSRAVVRWPERNATATATQESPVTT